MRGNLDASEYKSVVLGLIFLKYISDRFEDKYKQLVTEGDGFENDQDEYLAEGIFYVPQGGAVGGDRRQGPQPRDRPGDRQRHAGHREGESPAEGHPAEKFARPELDKRRLGDVVDLFTTSR